jgi:Leucine-rich repeat (LRR) protein
MNNLQGTLPTEVASLRSLSELHVYLNNIGGTLPTELGSLTSLSLLDLEVNHFEGKLFFDQLLNTNHTLQYLRGSDNQFVGSIPSWIGNLTGLQEFWAADNSLTGSIPTEITRLTDLGMFAFLEVYGKFDFILPAGLPLHRVAVSWYVYKNKLNGTIPSSIGSLTNLEEMDISSNNLQGSIPNSIGNVAKLERLVITQNSLTGSIPASLGRVATLVDVYLNKNHLTGSVPAGFGSLVNLRKFTASLFYLVRFSLKHFSSSFLITNCPSAEYLLLNGNYLTGSLTEYFSPVLTYVDMSNNALDGGIPSSFFDLPSLSYLYLSNNTLTGTIPSSFGGSITLEAIWLDGNKLNGTIPGVLTSVGRPKISEYSTLQTLSESKISFRSNNFLCTLYSFYRGTVKQYPFCHNSIVDWRYRHCQSNKW